MRTDKERIFRLRQEGRSYRQIQKETGVSRATLSTWFEHISWSKHLSQQHAEKMLGASKERMIRMNMTRKLALQWKYALAEKEATAQYETYRKDPLFWAGLMVYAGEGDREKKGLIKISTSDTSLHKIFLQFIAKYLKVGRQQVRCALFLYPDFDETTCKSYWSEELDLPAEQFYKTQIIKGKGRLQRLQYGVGMSIISNTSLKKKLMKWLSLAKEEKFDLMRS